MESVDRKNFGHLRNFMVAAATVGVLCLPASSQAEVHVGVGVSVGLPPPITFSVAPTLVALPGSYIYAVPDYETELFFVDGWWWRPWNGHWYRSHYYDRDWGAYSSVPYFYRSIPNDWRTEYRSGHWHGEPWNYQRVSYDDVHRNWSTWKKEKHWDRASDVRAAGNAAQGRRPAEVEHFKSKPSHGPKVTHEKVQPSHGPKMTHEKGNSQRQAHPAQHQSHSQPAHKTTGAKADHGQGAKGGHGQAQHGEGKQQKK